MTDAFLTHDWGQELGQDNHLRVSIVNDALKARHFLTWFDTELMEGDIRVAMANGIDRSECVIVFITRRYVDKVAGDDANDSCKVEFNYASTRKSGKLIPVVMERQMLNTADWNGPVGLTLCTTLFVDMTGDLSNASYLNSQVDQLCVAITRIIGSRNPLPTSSTKILVDLTVEDVCGLMQSLNLGAFKSSFVENGVDGRTLYHCDAVKDLVDLGISIQVKARVLMNELERFKLSGVPIDLFQRADVGNKGNRTSHHNTFARTVKLIKFSYRHATQRNQHNRHVILCNGQ